MFTKYDKAIAAAAAAFGAQYFMGPMLGAMDPMAAMAAVAAVPAFFTWLVPNKGDK